MIMALSVLATEEAGSVVLLSSDSEALFPSSLINTRLLSSKASLPPS